MLLSVASKTLTLVLALACTVCGAEAFAAQGGAAQTPRVGGVVIDAAGAPVGGAEVSLSAGASAARRVTTGDDGRFVFADVRGTEGSLSVSAEGFARRELRWSVAGGDGVAEVEVVLTPAPLSERVTVTATRTETKLGETAASVVVLTSRALSTTAAVTLDDALRQVPGFQLFRRTGSRAANPTAQGVSLRGVGASGASRALVLADGVPLNDPFGSWVYWGRIPSEAISQVEILRGPSGDLYGSAALSGVIQLVRRSPGSPGPWLVGESSAGERSTADGSLFAA